MRQVPTSFLPSQVSYYPLKILSFTAIGNLLELYDYVLYGVMLPIIAPLFFPADNPAISISLGFLTFALTFLVAPIGSIFWGWYGDKYGRIKMLRWSMYLMGVPALVIALLPTVQEIGWLAPAILILMRILQGISTSGEIMGGKIFAMEMLGPRYHGWVCGITCMTGALGVLLAMGVGYWISVQNWPQGWRLAFGVGSILFFVARYVRTKLALKLITKTRSASDLLPISAIIQIIRQNPHHSLLVFSLGALLGILSYMMHAFMNPYLIAQGNSEFSIYQVSVMGLLTTALAALLTGLIIDKNASRVFNLLKYNILLIIGLGGFSFNLLHVGGSQLQIGYCILSGLLGIYAVVSAVTMYRTFEATIRCRAVLFNYALGCAILGGLTPWVMHNLSLWHLVAPQIALISAAAITLVLVSWSQKHVTLH